MNYIYLNVLFFERFVINFSIGTKEEYDRMQMEFYHSGKKFTPEFKHSVHRL